MTTESPTAAELFALAAGVYTPEGVHIWMNSRNQLLDGERPFDLIERGDRARVAEVLHRITDGNCS